MFNEIELIKTFATRHKIEPVQLELNEREAAYWLEYSEFLMARAIQKDEGKLDQNPTWGILWRMIERTNRHAGNSLVLATLDQPASGEVLARTVLESAISVLYILHANSLERLNAYFADYIVTERQQNERWKKSIKKLEDANEIDTYRAGIKKKGEVLDLYEQVVREASKGLGVTYNPNAKWMTISDRFNAVNHEISYRTIYAALCSQAHSDAEDLLNEWVILSTNDDQWFKRLKLETENFSRMLIYSAIYFQLEAIGTFGYIHNLKEVADKMMEGYAKVSKIAQYYATESTKTI